jgi:membrane-bound lytic murein transglycosylase B
MNLLKKLFLLSLLSGVVSIAYANAQQGVVDFTKKQEVRKFINRLCSEDDFNKQELNRLFCRIEIQESSLKYYTPAKKTKPKKKRKAKTSKKKRKPRQGSWTLYEKKLLNRHRVSGGVAFMIEHRDTLAKAEKIYGVPPEYITAVIGIESHYGRYAGKYPVLDTLATLAFEKNRRNRFFTLRNQCLCKSRQSTRCYLPSL